LKIYFISVAYKHLITIQMSSESYEPANKRRKVENMIVTPNISNNRQSTCLLLDDCLTVLLPGTSTKKEYETYNTFGNTMISKIASRAVPHIPSNDWHTPNEDDINTVMSQANVSRDQATSILSYYQDVTEAIIMLTVD
jgi:NACalpha-BTF3-like transcription factor